MYICWTDEEVAKGSLKFDNEVRRERKWPFLSNSRDAAEFHRKSRWVWAEGRVRYTIMSPICLKRKVQFQLEYYCQARYFFFVPAKSINEQIFRNCKFAYNFFKMFRLAIMSYWFGFILLEISIYNVSTYKIFSGFKRWARPPMTSIFMYWQLRWISYNTRGGGIPSQN